jgi:hypothetical protein
MGTTETVDVAILVIAMKCFDKGLMLENPSQITQRNIEGSCYTLFQFYSCHFVPNISFAYFELVSLVWSILFAAKLCL